MTDTALKSAFFGADPLNPALKAASVQKTAQPSAGSAQDFGAVLDKTAQKIENSKQPSADRSENSKPQQPKEVDASTEADEMKQGEIVEDVDTVVDEKVSDTVPDMKETAVEGPETEETVDEMTIDEIAHALEQIIVQIKEILGITDEELMIGMEELDLQPYDLLNADNISQLVATISGEDSVISLVANEELYTAMQDITAMVETQVGELLDQTGLTSEEFETILQKLQEMENQDSGEQILSFETEAAEAPVEQPAVKEQVADEPIVKYEDNTKSTEQPAKQYDTLPEKPQENSVEVSAKPQTQGSEKDAKGSDEKGSENFSQDHASQNFQSNLNEMNDVTAAEGIEKFTSESTDNIMRQLADMVKIIKNENLTEMELQLHPASLGTVNVSLTTKGGVVTAEFTTQNETVKAAIEAQASQLRANLEEQGVKVEAIEVSVESHQMERNLDKNGQEQQRQAQAQEQERGRIQGIRRGRSSINLRAFTDGEELEGEMQGADDATRIAMEIMAANGNTMDLLV